MATSYSYGEWQNLGYQNSKTPEPIVWKFGIGDYVGDTTPHAKIETDRSSGYVQANGWDITIEWFLFFCDPKFCSRPETKPLLDSWNVDPSYCIPEGMKLQKVSVFHHFYPETPKMERE